jgi:hypothetical protein
MFGVGGGFGDDPRGLTIAPLYLETPRTPAFAEMFGQAWPEKLVPICEWGEDNLSGIDCRAADAQIVDVPEGTRFERRGFTLAQWLEAWLNGEELWPWGCGNEPDSE